MIGLKQHYVNVIIYSRERERSFSYLLFSCIITVQRFMSSAPIDNRVNFVFMYATTFYQLWFKCTHLYREIELSQLWGSWLITLLLINSTAEFFDSEQSLLMLQDFSLVIKRLSCFLLKYIVLCGPDIYSNELFSFTQESAPSRSCCNSVTKLRSSQFKSCFSSPVCAVV